MKLVHVGDVEHPPEGKLLARPLLEGEHCNVRIIRLGGGQALPPHRHRDSDLMLYVVDGAGELDTSTGAIAFVAGDVAWYSGDEELRVRNRGGGR